MLFIEECSRIRKARGGTVARVDDNEDDGAEEEEEEGEAGDEDPDEGPLLHPKAGRQVFEAWQLQCARSCRLRDTWRKTRFCVWMDPTYFGSRTTYLSL